METMELSMCGVTLGKNYPDPVIDHKQGREAALAAFQQFKESRDS